MTKELTSVSRHRRRHRSGRRDRHFDVSRWLTRATPRKLNAKRLTMLAVYLTVALFCILVGYYYLGPKITNMGE